MKNSDVSADVELKFIKRVHFNLEQERELEKHAEGSSRYKRRKKEPKVETEDEIWDRKRIQSYVKEVNKQNLETHFNYLKRCSTYTVDIRKQYGEGSTEVQKEEKQIVSLCITEVKLLSNAVINKDKDTKEESSIKPGAFLNKATKSQTRNF